MKRLLIAVPHVGVALVGVALVTSSCDEPANETELLARQIPVAEKDWNGTLLELGSPRALPHLSEDGWSHGETAPDGNTFRWAVGETASLRFTSDREGETLAWLECEPFLYEGGPTQWIALSVNGADVAEVELRPGRESYPVGLPLVVGENTVAMRFRYAGDPNRRSADRRELAVAFYRFDIPPPGETPVAGRRGAFSTTDSGVHMPAGSALTFYADVDGEARLHLTTSIGGIGVIVRSEHESLVDETVETAGSWERRLEVLGPVSITVNARDEAVVRPELWVPAAEPTSRAAETTSRAVDPVDANVVLVFLDGASVRRLSPQTTPVLDALERESIVFDTAVTQAVYTIASIGSVLTSQYPERHQSVSFAEKLASGVVTLPEVLSDHGYRTSGFSGNAVASKNFGLDQGYDEYFQIWERDDYTGHGDSVLAAFREWLGQVGDERFFAYVHFREPHFPYNPPPPFDARFGASDLFPEGMSDWDVVEAMNTAAAAGSPPPDEVLERVRALYDGNFAYVDSLVGELLRCLEEDGLAERTIVIVTADHGEALFEHDYIGHNTQLYEESVRVPLMMRIPGREPGRVETPVELIDLAPTILDLAGAPVPETMQGRSLLVPDAERMAFTRTVWKRARYSVRTDRFKLIWDSRTGKTELYDLETDPGERDDVADERDFVSGYLQQRLLAWLRTQETLRGVIVPGSADLTEEQLRKLRALGYADFLEPKR